MSISQRFLHTLCDVLVFLSLLGFITPLPILARDKGGQQEVGDDLREEADDEDDNRDDRDGKDRLERCLRALSEGKKVPKKCPQGGSSSGIAKGDFNGDGFADLAVGVPGEDTPASRPDAGAVIVIYGSGTGLTATTTGIPASQFWSQNAAGVPDTSEADDSFGSALAAGDFNDDGFSDLAIGANGEDIEFPSAGTGVFENLGAVTVIYGSANGLTTTNPPVAAQFWDERDFDAFDQGRLVLVDGDGFGSSLAWGDFNNDGVGDLAIGVPNKNLFQGALLPEIKVGAVAVLYGSRNNGLTSFGHQVWSQDGPIGGSPEDGDQFGTALAVGDFNGDTFSDLAVSVPGEDVINNNVSDAGAVNIIYGSSIGLASIGNQFWSQSSPNIGGGAEEGDHFGRTLSAGDFNGDGRADLAIGVPDENLSGSSKAGAVNVIYGSANGLSATAGPGNQFWDQSRIFPGSTTINERDGDGTPTEAGDFFGAALAAGDFNADGRDDLAIGAPFEDVLVQRTATSFENVIDAGAVNVIYGSATGLSLTGHAPQFWNQQSINIEDDAEAGDRFGSSLTAWNFGRNENRILPPDNFTVVAKTADLAIGVPRENVGTIVDAGAVNVIYGSFSANGLTFSNDQIWTQASPGVPGGPEAGDHFGEALY